ncbi:MAG: MarR family transcriptional regulator [Gemmatimonadota bacterium]|nr:MarR family transcriptional regulator [Gemmatimonadota bacterium]
MALYRAADGVRTFMETVIEPYGITGQQYNVLRILRGAEADGLPTLTIAERMLERAPGITRMIDRLETKGLVVRERRPDDRRCVYCRITGKGLELLKRLDRPVEEADRAVFAALAPRELGHLMTLLARVPTRRGAD